MIEVTCDIVMWRYPLILGLQQSVECLKSLSLALALCESEIDVERAVYLSRLEQAYQIETWGSVEWSHDIEVQETQARVAAATIFIHLCHDFSSTQSKQKSNFMMWTLHPHEVEFKMMMMMMYCTHSPRLL